jgi:hypothetical protein
MSRQPKSPVSWLGALIHEVLQLLLLPQLDLKSVWLAFYSLP